MNAPVINRSARTMWVSQPVRFNGREFRRVRFGGRGERPVFVTWAVREHKSRSVMSATFMGRRAA